MSNETTITITGNAVADPELRYTPSGPAGGQVPGRVDPALLRQAGQRVERRRQPVPDLPGVEQPGEHVAESVTQGTRVIVTGRLRQRSYETKEGEKRTVYEVECR